jgi:hypothetical protein
MAEFGLERLATVATQADGNDITLFRALANSLRHRVARLCEP